MVSDDNWQPDLTYNQIKAQIVLLLLCLYEGLLKRITFDKDVLYGMPLIRGLRISIEMLLELLKARLNKNTVSNSKRQLEPTSLWLSIIPKGLE